MTKNELIESASRLNVPGTTSLEEFSQKTESLAAELNLRMTARKDLEKLVGKDNTDMMQDNSRNMVRFMSSLMTQYDPLTFVETCMWVFKSYRNHGFQVTYWPAHVDTFIEIMKEQLSETGYSEIYPFFNWIIVNIPAFVKLTDEDIREIN